MIVILAAAFLGAPQDEDLGSWQARRHGWQINTGPLEWNGFLIHPTAEFGAGLSIDASDVDFESGGTAFRLKYEEKNFYIFGGGVEVDFGLLRLGVDALYGRWTGSGRMIQTPDAGPIDSAAEFDGTIFGVHGKLWWPAVIYHAHDVDVTFGPGVGFFWMRETLTDTHAEDLAIENDAVRDTISNEKGFTVGFFATYELPLGPIKFVVEAGIEVPLFGDLTKGILFDVLIGPKIGWSF